MLLYLPEAIVRFAETNPSTDIVPYFQYYGMEESFLRGEQDIYVGIYDNVRRYPELRLPEPGRTIRSVHGRDPQTVNVPYLPPAFASDHEF